MVRLVLNDPERPIDLFAQDHTHQLVRECHFGKAECQVRPFADAIVKDISGIYEEMTKQMWLFPRTLQSSIHAANSSEE